jgi:hypothetical protein
MQVLARCIHEQNVKIISAIMILVKNLAMDTPRRKYRIRQEYYATCKLIYTVCSVGYVLNCTPCTIESM